MLHKFFKIASGEAFRPLTSLVIYQDPDSRRQVEQLFDRMLNGALNGTDFQAAWVRIEWLEEEERAREQASDAALEAALVIVSAPINAVLSDPVRQWFDAWTPGKRGQSSAMVLMGQPYEEFRVRDNALQRYLKNLARRGGMDFFFRGPKYQPKTRIQPELTGLSGSNPASIFNYAARSQSKDLI